jgi:hypothetical protein
MTVHTMVIRWGLDVDSGWMSVDQVEFNRSLNQHQVAQSLNYYMYSRRATILRDG